MGEAGGSEFNETEKFPVISDPKEYFETFANSPEVQAKIDARYQTALQKDPTVTREEASKIFFGQKEAKDAILTYYETHDRNFKLDRTILSPEFDQALQNYFDIIDMIQFKEAQGEYGGNQDQMNADDHKRTIAHNGAAQRMVDEGIVPNVQLGRQLIHFMTVSAGIERFNPNKDEQKWQAIANMPLRKR